MDYIHEIEDEISRLKWKIINTKCAQDAKDDYRLFGKTVAWLILEFLKHSDATNSEKREAYYYELLERILSISDPNEKVNGEHLVNFLILDKGFKQYCEEHIENDGIVAVLKYSKPIRYKTDLIKKALALANQA